MTKDDFEALSARDADPKAMKLFKENPRQSIKKALGGSDLDTKAIAVCMSAYPESLPDDAAVDAFRMFQSHLDERKHAQILQADKRHVICAIDSLFGLGSMRGHATRVKELVSVIEREWPKLFKSLRTFVDKYSSTKNERFTEVIKRQFQVVVPIAFLLLDGNRELAAKLYSDSKNLQFVTRLWLDEPEHQPIDNSCGTASASETLVSCISRSQDPPEALERFVNGVKGGRDRIAEIVSSRFRESLKQEPLSPRFVAGQTYLLCCLTSEYRNPMISALMKKHVMPMVTKGIISLAGSDASISESADDREQVAIACAHCFVFIKNCCHHTYGWPWFTQAVKFGLLDAFCRCALLFPIMKKAGVHFLEGIEELFGVLYPKFLAYHSIISCSMEAMKKVVASRLHHLARACILGDVWETFECLLLERMVRMREYDHIVKGRVKRTGCYYCEKESEKTQYKKCAACKEAFYCSKECQQKDWKRHKGNCATSGVNSTADVAVTKLDNAFKNKIAISGVHRHMPAINDMVWSNPSLRKLKQMERGIRVDFAKVPPLIEIILVEDLVREAEASKDQTQIISSHSTREQIYRSNNVLTLLQIELFEGEGAAINHSLARSEVVYQFPPAHREGTKNECAPRMNFQDKNGRVLDAMWDDTDEIIYRMKLQKEDRWISGTGSSSKSTFVRLEEVLSELVSDGRADFGPQASRLNMFLPSFF